MLFFRLLNTLIFLPKFKNAKPFTLHCGLLFVVLIYSFAAGMIFRWLESDSLETRREQEWRTKITCVHQVFDNATFLTYHNYKPDNMTLEKIINCFPSKADAKSTWSPLTAAFYGFGIATTLGYNYLAPVTISGRMFVIVYGIISIPVTMIIVANVGQYLHQFAGSMKKNIEVYNKRRRPSKAHFTEDDIPDASVTVASLGLLLFFLLYVSLGALFLPLLNGEMDFWNGLYVNFICLTAIDGFGHLVPKNLAYWPITFLYILIGLAITTIAIDIGSQFMKKLHHLGQKVKNVASTKIWFGGKTWVWKFH
ncbi:hypothetical protein FO519_002658 [Halicephalobus sp. NKZ332]|nr:hypothetical protein FO519_002658 [Halicephalobus sp. NKZ332]